MIDWGIPDDELVRLAAGVGRSAERRDDVDEAIAAALWSVLVEPGDRAAGVLLGAVGTTEAARILIEEPVPVTVSTATGGELDPPAAKRALDRWLPRRRRADLLRALDSAARCGALLVVPSDDAWPASLHDLGEHAPVALWVRGDLSLLARPAVAIVGARAASGYGEHVAMELAAGAAQRGIVVVSGGAYGIDGMAHRAALASSGDTVAVLAGGVDRLYPAGHEALLTRVAEQGAIIAEAPCGTAPTRWRFLQRNRVIAALGGATLVVEAGRRSGSLSTARKAIELGRPVGAVPGPVTSATSAGCHALLRETPAVCVTNPVEMAELLEPFSIVQLAAADSADGADGDPVAGDAVTDGAAVDPDGMTTRVLDALRPRRGQSVDELARAVGESPSRIRSVLGALALDDRVGSNDGGWVRSGRR